MVKWGKTKCAAGAHAKASPPKIPKEYKKTHGLVEESLSAFSVGAEWLTRGDLCRRGVRN